MIKEAVAKLISKEPLGRQEAAAAMTDIMSGAATDAQIGAFITGLRLKGETPEIIAGCAEVMRANATQVKCDDPNAVDIVGTGGDAYLHDLRDLLLNRDVIWGRKDGTIRLADGQANGGEGDAAPRFCP